MAEQDMEDVAMVKEEPMNDSGSESDADREHFEPPDLASSIAEANAAVCKRVLVDGTKVPYPYLTTFSDIGKFLGVGNGLYFTFLLLVTIIFIIGGLMHIPVIRANMAGSRIPEANRNWVTTMSLGNTDGAYGSAWPHGVIYLLFMLLFMVYCIVLNMWQEQQVKLLDLKSITADDYSVIVYKFGKHIVDPVEYAKYFSQFGEIARVAVGVDFGKMVAHQEEIQGLKGKIDICNAKKAAPEKIKVLEDKLTLKKKKLKAESDIARKGTRLYVSFMYETGARRCIQTFQRRGLFQVLCWCCCRPKETIGPGKKKIALRRAPFATDVIWKNLHFTKRQRITRDGIGTIISLLLVGASASMLASATIAQREADKNQDTSMRGTVMRILIAVGIIFINKGLVFVLTVIAKWTKPHTFTGLEDELLAKLCAALFLNTGMMVYFVSPQVHKLGWYWSTDFAQSNLMRIINIPFLVKRFILAPRAVTARQQLNWLVGDDWHLSERYAAVLKTVLMAIAYGPALPMGYFVCAGALFVTFWVDKWNLLRSCKAPPEFDAKMSTLSIKLMMWGTLISGIMASVFFYGGDASWSGITVICLGILAIVYFYFTEVKEFVTCEKGAITDQGTGGKAYVAETSMMHYEPPPLKNYPFPLVWVNPNPSSEMCAEQQRQVDEYLPNYVSREAVPPPPEGV